MYYSECFVVSLPIILPLHSPQQTQILYRHSLFHYTSAKNVCLFQCLSPFHQMKSIPVLPQRLRLLYGQAWAGCLSTKGFAEPRIG